MEQDLAHMMHLLASVTVPSDVEYIPNRENVSAPLLPPSFCCRSSTKRAKQKDVQQQLSSQSQAAFPPRVLSSESDGCDYHDSQNQKIDGRPNSLESLTLHPPPSGPSQSWNFSTYPQRQPCPNPLAAGDSSCPHVHSHGLWATSSSSRSWCNCLRCQEAAAAKNVLQPKHLPWSEPIKVEASKRRRSGSLDTYMRREKTSSKDLGLQNKPDCRGDLTTTTETMRHRHHSTQYSMSSTGLTRVDCHGIQRYHRPCESVNGELSGGSASRHQQYATSPHAPKQRQPYKALSSMVNEEHKQDEKHPEDDQPKTSSSEVRLTEEVLEQFNYRNNKNNVTQSNQNNRKNQPYFYYQKQQQQQQQHGECYSYNNNHSSGNRRKSMT